MMVAINKAALAKRLLTTAGLFLAGTGLGIVVVMAVLYKLGGVTVCTQDGKVEDVRVGSTCLK